MSKQVKTSKTASKTVAAKKAKKAARAERSTVTLSPATKISFKSPRPEGAGGPKTAVLALVPRKGTITFKQLAAKAEAEELNTARLAKWLTGMAKNGRVEIHA